MQKLSIPTGEAVKAVPLKDGAGCVLCTVYCDPADTGFAERYQSAKKTMKKVFRRLKGVGIKADGSPAALRYAFALNAAEREVKQAVSQLLPMDNPDGLFSARRPFASIKGSFYCTHVVKALSEAVKATAEADRA